MAKGTPAKKSLAPRYAAFCKALRLARERAGLTQVQAAIRMRVPSPTIEMRIG